MLPASQTLHSRIDADESALADFCRRWKIVELAVFGSVLREDFGPESDIDVLVTFAPGSLWSVLDHVSMEEELGLLLGRRVDLVNREAVARSANWARRQAILGTARRYYVPG